MHAIRILRLCELEGLDPARLYFSHLDEVIDPTYHRQVLEQGATIGFGCDTTFGKLWRSPTDREKAAGLARLVEMGFEDQLVLGHDACLRHQLKSFGGMGLDHVSLRIIPWLQDSHGISDITIEKLFTLNPRRLLTRTG
jgi:phosphotriesterase-related protein